MIIEVIKGDLTRQKVDAIVNPANSYGVMGGGVALTIAKRGGREIEKEAMSKAPIRVGKAVITTPGKLPCRAIIHAPTMKEPAQQITAEYVRAATHAALVIASQNKFRTLAFPGMGTGVGGVEPKAAMKVMLEEITKHPQEFDRIIIAAYNEELYATFKTEILWPRLRKRTIDGKRELVVAIAQDNSTFEVLMTAFQNREALYATLETGYMHYFSTSRNELWRKGEESGHVQKVIEIRIDCDKDALLFLVEQEVGACHTGHKSCFFKNLDGEIVSQKVFDPEEVYDRE